MTVSCPDCRSVFRVDPAKVPATGVRARCSVCGGIIVVSGGTGALRTPSRTPVASMAPGTIRATPIRSATPGPIVAPGAAPGAARPTPRAYPTPGAVMPRNATPAAVPGAVAAEPSREPVMRTPVAVPASAPTAASPTVPATAPTPRRAINPFLNADPGQRARRLARALVSDLVAYHPKKRDEGLAQGTLRQLFRDEIKKSYEEYVDQVGREIAETTPHFQEALNDILAGGQRLF